MTTGTCDHVRSEIERRSLVEVLCPDLVRPRVVDFVEDDFHGGPMSNKRSPHDRPCDRRSAHRRGRHGMGVRAQRGVVWRGALLIDLSARQ